MPRLLALLFSISITVSTAFAANYVLVADAVFDGERLHQDWLVRVEGRQITAVGKNISDANAERIELAGMTLLPGLIDAHSHVLLHPYDETAWNDQVLFESEAERAVRAANHLYATLMAGFTTLRDLGSEGAGYADVGLKQALAKRVIPGPRLLVAGPALVATGSYGPKGFHAGVTVPLGANQADGVDDLLKEVRRQIGGGADWIKVYADYRWGPDGSAQPTFSLEELQLIVNTARSSGRPTVAHAATDAGMRRTIEAGVETIEHGDGGSLETYQLMAQKGIALCPTLGAVEAISRYQGWDGNRESAPARIKTKQQQMQKALQAGVTICNGSDVGVFDHGDNAWELELLVQYGMTPVQALQAATSINASLLHLDRQIGRIGEGLMADIIAVNGNPVEDISTIRQIKFVMQAGNRVDLIAR